MEGIDIDWYSPLSHMLMNPSYSQEEKKRFLTLLNSAQELPGHIWLSTSGSQSAKWVGLSKEAILFSAKTVNDFLQSTKKDIWIQALPPFHVGGLGIWARSFLSGAAVFNYRVEHTGKWNASQFYNYVNEKQGTLTALVPAQLHDLILLQRPCPPSLRALIIGGGALTSSLYSAAIATGWPLLPSYGMTECSSQIATGGLNENTLTVLPHVKVKIEGGLINIKSKSLLSIYAFANPGGWNFVDPKVNGWYATADRGELRDGYLHLLGRSDSMIKIGGESVDMDMLEVLLQHLKDSLQLQGDITLVDMDDDRLGKVIHLAASGTTQVLLKPLIDGYHKSVMPYERIRQVHIVHEIPRSPLMKILKGQLRKTLH